MLGPVAQESVVDSALLRSIFRPFKPAFMYTTCTQSLREERAHYFWVAPSFVRKLTKVDSRAIEESLKWSERTPAPHLSTNRLLESKCFSRVHSRRAAGGNERCA